MIADLVLVDGNIVTMNNKLPTTEAVAIKKDKIIKLGKNEEITKYIGKRTKLINLNGKTVLPGFFDSHIHVADFGKLLKWLNLQEINSIKKIQEEIKKRTQKTPNGSWIIGNGWNQENFIEKRSLNLKDLDEAAPNHPVILYHQCGRLCVVNSKALELTGLTKTTEPPIGGKIEKDPKTGKLTGILSETATDLVWTKIPEPNQAELVELTKLAIKKIIQSGITSVHWIISSLKEVSIIEKLESENNLPLRFFVIGPANILDQLENMQKTLKSEKTQVIILGIKIFVDGSLAGRTAALNNPYSDDKKTKGKLLYSQQELDRLIEKVHKTNLSLIIHAMGDEAIGLALNSIEKALKKKPKKDHRYRLEHASVLNNKLIQKIKNLGMIISVQPKCISSEFSVWAAIKRLGFERAKMLYPLNTLIKKNIQIIGGSDCPMEPLSPLLGIQTTLERKEFPEERITINDALEMYTINVAYSSFQENNLGSIEEGKLADLTVISDDPRKVSIQEIGEIKTNLVIVGGKVVYQN